MANTTVGVDVNVKTNVAGSIGELKALKKQLKETAAGSAEFKNLANQIDDLEDKIKGARQGAGDWVDQLASAGGPLGALGNALNKAKVSTVSFGTALKATGIGLVVTLVAGLVAAFAESEKATKKLQPLLIGFQKIFAGIFAAIEPVFNAFVDFAVEALPMVTKGIGMAYSAVTAFIQGLGLLGSAVSKLIKGDFSGAWDSAKEAVTGFGERYDEANKRFIDGTKEVTKTEQEELDKRKEAAEKAAEERRKREEAEQQYQDQLEELRKRKFEENLKFGKSLRDADYKLREEERKKEEENERKFLENRDKVYQAAIERGLQNLDGLRKTAEEKNTLLGELLVEQDVRELERLDAEYRRKYNLIKGNKEAELALEKQYEDLKKNLRMNALNRELTEYASAAASISQLLGQQTAAGKAFAIAEATINTYKAANQVFSKPAPGDPATSLSIKIASMIAALATGFKNVRAIVATKPSATVGGTAIATPSIGSAPIPPQPPLVNTRTQLDAATIQQMGSATNRAYVVESDVTNSQERIRRINRAARLA
jgi:hypothetical protein